jgi:hypothetical protein
MSDVTGTPQRQDSQMLYVANITSITQTAQQASFKAGVTTFKRHNISVQLLKRHYINVRRLEHILASMRPLVIAIEPRML